jgi:hypothetical protein
MSSCTSCGSASQSYANAQSYIKQRLEAFQKPELDVEQKPANGQFSLNATGRGQLLNVSA